MLVSKLGHGGWNLRKEEKMGKTTAGKEKRPMHWMSRLYHWLHVGPLMMLIRAWRSEAQRHSVEKNSGASHCRGRNGGPELGDLH
jgi:hypothetical protein